MRTAGPAIAAVLLLGLASAASLAPPAAASQRVLVLLESLDLQQSHSEFFGGLSSRGYQLDFKQVSDKMLQLRDWDTWLYDKVIIFAVKGDLGGAIDTTLLAEFVDDGHDLLLAVGSGVSEELRELAQEMGVDLDARDTAVIDHFSFDGQLGAADHTAVLATDILDTRAVFSQPLKAPVLFRGIGMSLPRETELAFLALWGSPTAYSSKPGTALTEVTLAGSELGLVALVQARNNARVAVAGSIDMFSNEFFRHSLTSRLGESLGSPSNAAFCSGIAKWTFHERGVLHAHNLRHRVVGGPLRPEQYRVSDDVEFSVDIFLCEEGSCVPYKAKDVQVELVMLDPYIRTTLQHDDKGTFSKQVKVPDTYGVFKWVLQYHRPGYSYIDMTETVPIRPFRHDEYERFIQQAYPYYASVFSVMAGFFAVGFFFLYHK
ncbi:hypothetical protein N2152v2_008970 [Parachlorella kessleri]